jgi:hypothetical protein
MSREANPIQEAEGIPVRSTSEELYGISQKGSKEGK